MKLLILIFAAAISSCGSNYSPMEAHTDYILSSHNDNCKYELGECTTPECSHSDKMFRDYQLELLADSTQIWDGYRLVSTIHYTQSIDSVLQLDNQ